jgi:molybdopterin converting factor small subunit
MKINVEFLGLPMISNVVGGKKLELELSGKSVKDVIAELIKRFGKEVRDTFYDRDGNFDLLIQIVLNRKSLIPADKHDMPLKEGDSLTFMILVAGG